MNAKSAEIFLQCYRPGMSGDDPRIKKAVDFAERDEGLKKKLAEQTDFDNGFVRDIAQINVPASLPARLDACVPVEEHHAFDWRSALRQPPFVGAVIGLLFIAGWGVYLAWAHLQNFPGKDSVMELVEVNDRMTGMEMEPKVSELGKLEDWLFSKYGFEDFYVPPALATYTTAGCRVFKQDDMPVAQFAVNEHGMLCYMFRAENLGVELNPQNQWRVFEDGEWVAALQQHGEDCFMVAMRGNRAAMRKFLGGLH